MAPHSSHLTRALSQPDDKATNKVVRLPLDTHRQILRLKSENVFKSDQTLAQATENVNKLAVYQGIIFVTLFIGYASYTFTRKSLTYAAPTLIAAGILTQSKTGLINSSQYFAYALSKFFGGIVSDRLSARLLFSIGLALSGTSALLVCVTTQSSVWVALWFINGLGQGCGWPACSKLIRKWFNSKHFGTCWSLLTASSNVSGTFGPILSTYLLIMFGWQSCLLTSGVISILMGLASIILLKDSPDKDYEALHQMELQNEKNLPSNGSVTKEEMSPRMLIMSPLLWIVSLCYLIVFATKTALSDWGQVYLMENLGYTQMQASAFNSSLETGGFFGGIFAGVVTDRLGRKVLTKGNPRLLISTAFMAVCIFSLHILLFFATPDTSKAAISFVGALIGASLFGPISIFGIVASESFPSSISGTAHAIVALAANIGAIMAGWPLSTLATREGWSNCFFLLEITVGLAVLTILLSTRWQQAYKTKTN